jgi:glutaredoxin 3
MSGMPRGFDVEHIPPGAKLELYISPACPYCRRAIAYYESMGTPYTSYDAQNDRDARGRMLAHSHGDPTVPAIVVNGEYVQSGWGSPPQG